jgi:hypothetical protein
MRSIVQHGVMFHPTVLIRRINLVQNVEQKCGIGAMERAGSRSTNGQSITIGHTKLVAAVAIIISERFILGATVQRGPEVEGGPGGGQTKGDANLYFVSEPLLRIGAEFIGVIGGLQDSDANAVLKVLIDAAQ